MNPGAAKAKAEATKLAASPITTTRGAQSSWLSEGMTIYKTWHICPTFLHILHFLKLSPGHIKNQKLLHIYLCCINSELLPNFSVALPFFPN